jgi:hypothetical protein
LAPSAEGLDDGHAAAAAGTGRKPIERFWLWQRDGLWRRSHGKQFAGSRYIGLACGNGVQAVMADAVEATLQDMKQEAADELLLREGHDALPLRTIKAVVFVAEGQKVTPVSLNAIRRRFAGKAESLLCDPVGGALKDALRYDLGCAPINVGTKQSTDTIVDLFEGFVEYLR